MMMGRPKKEPTRLVRVKLSVIGGLRNEFPNVSTDGDRVANVFDYYRKVQTGVNGIGSFIYGKRTWKKVTKK